MSDELLSDLFALLSWVGAQRRPSEVETIRLRVRERLVDAARVAGPAVEEGSRWAELEIGE
jgi:hypothetical protein